jgi:hypothetical protein
MRKNTLLKSSVVALGVATGSLLAPQAASALDFNFIITGFSNPSKSVSGMITNLVDNTQNQKCDTLASCTVMVNSNSTGAPNVTYDYSSGTGFDVTSGFITYAFWSGSPTGGGSQNDPLGASLGLFPDCISVTTGNPVNPPQGDPVTCQGNLVYNTGTTLVRVDGGSSFSPKPVPGPLPIFGAAAALGWSRRLKKRIVDGNNTVSPAPFG